MAETVENEYLERLYNLCNGRRSHYLILREESEEDVKLLLREGWVTRLPNNSKQPKPWFVASEKLILRFQPDVEIKQKEVGLTDEQISIGKVLKENKKVKKETKSTLKEVDSIEHIPEGTIFGPGGVRYENAKAAAAAEGVPAVVIINRCRSVKNTEWTEYS